MCLLLIYNHLDHDILIGCHIFKDQSLITITDYTRSHIIRRELPAIHRISEGFGSEISEVDVPAEFRSDLQAILRDFTGMITTGNKVGVDNNVSLKIRLEKDIIVNRTLYRLAINDRAK